MMTMMMMMMMMMSMMATRMVMTMMVVMMMLMMVQCGVAEDYEEDGPLAIQAVLCQAWQWE
eukprot:3999225-Karenia_brevis.AAC.1